MVHDLEAMPDDGRRYEIIDGMLLVTPAPGWAHQEMRLGVPSYWLLNPVPPGGLEVYELDEQGHYQLAAKVDGDEVFAAHQPFPVRICPARLLDGLRPP